MLDIFDKQLPSVGDSSTVLTPETSTFLKLNPLEHI